MCDAVNNEPGRLPDLEALTDALPTAVMVVDRQGKIVLANTLVSRLLGIPTDQRLDGKHMWQALPLGVREVVAAMQREVLIYGAEVRRDVEFTPVDGGVQKLLDVQLAPVAGRGEEPEFFSLSFSEAVDRQEIAELKKLDVLKSNFLAMISHELRTPLTSIRGAVHLLADESRASTDPNKALVNIIQGNSERLIRLVNNLLEMVAIDNNTFMVSRSRLEIAPLVNQAVEKCQAAAKAKFLKLESDLDAGTIGDVDPERFVQLVGYLIDNAIKYTPHGGQIVVRASVGTGGTLNLLVSDTGSGVPAFAREKIFDRFYQVEDPMTRCCGGAGVGLYLARHIAESHGGKLWMEANPAGGSDFRAIFPAMARVPFATEPSR